jgi:hypothetical protein
LVDDGRDEHGGGAQWSLPERHATAPTVTRLSMNAVFLHDVRMMFDFEATSVEPEATVSSSARSVFIG